MKVVAHSTLLLVDKVTKLNLPSLQQFEQSITIMSPSRFNIQHVTEIKAPIDKVSDQLLDIAHWDWNLWTKLDALEAKTGVNGKLKACYEGDDVAWETFDFTFGPVDEYLLTWIGSVGPWGMLFHGYHTMKLEAIDAKTTRLTHTEVFAGLLPMLGLGLPYKKLDENYLKMNNAFKAHVEA